MRGKETRRGRDQERERDRERERERERDREREGNWEREAGRGKAKEGDRVQTYTTLKVAQCQGAEGGRLGVTRRRLVLLDVSEGLL